MVNVVVAFQSPTLFNILARSDEWKLWMSPMGDHEDLKEMDLREVPVWNRSKHPMPDLVLVCSPAHLETARSRYPNTPVVWVLHNGRHRHLLPTAFEKHLVGAMVFSQTVQWLQGRRTIPVHFVSPAYEAQPIWQWRPNLLWTLRNRPKTRSDDLDAVVSAITAGLDHTFYGQGQPAGFATSDVRTLLTRGCSAYVAALDRCAGFGLSQHECFAFGVPVIGGWWGDLPDELSYRYWGLQNDLFDMQKAAQRVARDPVSASVLSQLGVEYIRSHRTKERMNESIRVMLESL